MRYVLLFTYEMMTVAKKKENMVITILNIALALFLKRVIDPTVQNAPNESMKYIFGRK